MKIFKYTKENNKQAHTHHLCFTIVYRVPYLTYVYFANYCKLGMWTSLVVHWLRLCASKTAPHPHPHRIPWVLGQGTRSRVPQLRVCMPAVKTRCSQINT